MMYFEEKMIDGIVHYRQSPEEEFIPYKIDELSRRYVKEQKVCSAAITRLAKIKSLVDGRPE